MTGDYQAASDSFERALKGNRRLRGRLGEAQILTEYGALQRLTGDYQAASANLTRAIELNRELDYPLGEAQALNAAGELSLESARLSDARAKYEKARQIAIAMQSPPEEARALEGIGRCHLRDGRRADGIELLRQACPSTRRSGPPAPDTSGGPLTTITADAAGSPLTLISWLGRCPAEGLERIRQADASCMNIHDRTTPGMHSHAAMRCGIELLQKLKGQHSYLFTGAGARG